MSSNRTDDGREFTTPKYMPISIDANDHQFSPLVGLKCQYCYSWLTQDDWTRWFKSNVLECGICGKRQSSTEALYASASNRESLLSSQYLGVLEGDYGFYTGENHPSEKTWFHATIRHDWLSPRSKEEKDNPYIHLGSLDSAIDRAEQMAHADDYSNRALWIYEVSVSRRAKDWSGFAVDDQGRTSVWLDLMKSNPTVRTLRYLNVFESPGSISLVCDARFLQVVKKIETTMLNFERKDVYKEFQN